MDSSWVRAAPVATTWVLMPELFFRVARAPSMRGWMFSEPGVAMNSATSPEGTSDWMCWPISCPDTYRSWPM